MAKNNQELAPTENTDMMIFGDNEKGELVNYQEDAGLGNENVGQDDLTTPRLVLLQGLSNVISSQSVVGAAPGMFHNTVTDELFKEKYIVPLDYQKQYAVFRKRNAGGGFKASFDTEQEGLDHAETLKGGLEMHDVSESARQVFLTLKILDNGDWEIDTPVVMHFANTALSTSNNMNSAIQMTLGSNKPRFAGVWKLGVTTKENSEGKWFAPSFTFAGKVGASKYQIVRELFYKITGKVDPTKVNKETGEIAA